MQDGEYVSVVCFDPFVELAQWTEEDLPNGLYVRIPSNITHIEDRAFDDCDHLEEVLIPSTVTSLGSEAFSGCRFLKAVTISQSVRSIGQWAFAGCSLY